MIIPKFLRHNLRSFDVIAQMICSFSIQTIASCCWEVLIAASWRKNNNSSNKAQAKIGGLATNLSTIASQALISGRNLVLCVEWMMCHEIKTMNTLKTQPCNRLLQKKKRSRKQQKTVNCQEIQEWWGSSAIACLLPPYPRPITSVSFPPAIDDVDKETARKSTTISGLWRVE